MASLNPTLTPHDVSNPPGHVQNPNDMSKLRPEDEWALGLETHLHLKSRYIYFPTMMVGQEGDRTGVKKEEMRGTGLETCSRISSPGMFFFP